MKKTLFFIAMVIILVSCSGDKSYSEDKSRSENKSYTTYEVNPNPEFMKKVAIPTGYKLIGAVKRGYYAEEFILYVQDEKGSIYQCIEGQIKSRVIIPTGYKLVAASSYGNTLEKTTLYLENSKGEVFVRNL